MNKMKGKERIEKRKKEYDKRKQRTKKAMMASIIAIAIICGGALITLSMTGKDNNNPSDSGNDSFYETASGIFIPQSSLDASAQYFSFDSDGVDIRYFGVKDDDGDVHVALDACDLCFDAKKGYVQVDDIMRCRNCGKQFPVINIGTENIAGGCWPSYLPAMNDGKNVVIEKSDLEAKRYMFE